MKKPASATRQGASSLLYRKSAQPSDSGPRRFKHLNRIGPRASALRFGGTRQGGPLFNHAAMTCSSSSVIAVSVRAASGAKLRMKSAAFEAALAARTIALLSSCKTSSQEPI